MASAGGPTELTPSAAGRATTRSVHSSQHKHRAQSSCPPSSLSPHRQMHSSRGSGPALAPSAHLLGTSSRKACPRPHTTPAPMETGTQWVPGQVGAFSAPVVTLLHKSGLSRYGFITRNVFTACKINMSIVLRFYHKRMHVLFNLKILPVLSGHLAKGVQFTVLALMEAALRLPHTTTRYDAVASAPTPPLPPPPWRQRAPSPFLPDSWRMRHLTPSIPKST